MKHLDAMDWMVFTLNSYVDALTPNVAASGDRFFKEVIMGGAQYG